MIVVRIAKNSARAEKNFILRLNAAVRAGWQLHSFAATNVGQTGRTSTSRNAYWRDGHYVALLRKRR